MRRTTATAGSRLPEPARRVVVTHVRELRQGMGGPRCQRNAVLHEVLADLTDATEAYLASGCAPVDAATKAVRDFGDPVRAAAGISEVLRETVQVRRSRVVGSLAMSMALVWCATFLSGAREPWSERVEPLGVDTSDTVATVSVVGAAAVALLCGTVAFLRRRGRITARVSRGERVVTMVNVTLLVCSALVLAESIGVRVDRAPWSWSGWSLGLAGCAVLVLWVGVPRHRLPRMADPFDGP